MSIIHKFNIFSEIDQQLVNQIKLFYLSKYDLLFVTTGNIAFQYNKRDRELKKFPENHVIIKLDCSNHSIMPHYMALTDYSWGFNSDGQLGNASKIRCDEPKFIDSLNKEFIIDICCGNMHSVVLTREGSVLAFGFGFSECSEFSETYHLLTVIINAPKVKSISCRNYYSIALTENGDVFGWGVDRVEQVVNERIIPTQLNVPKIKQIKCGPFFSVMLSFDGDIYFCGQIEDCLSNEVPTQLNSTAKFKEIADTIHSDLCVALSEENICYIFGSYEDSVFDLKPTINRIVVNDLHETTLFASINTTYALLEQINYKTIWINLN